MPQTSPVLDRLRTGATRLAGLVATPLVPSDYLDLVDPLRSGGALRGRIVAVEPETADAPTLVIKPGRGWAGPVPGQYLRLGVEVDGVRLWRSYSLTSPRSRPDGCVTVTVKAVADGAVSTHLARHARPGQVVHLDQAAGEFVLPAVRPAKVLFLTAGSGMFIYALLQHHPQALTLGLLTLVAMTGACMISGLCGAIVPMALRRFGADPATASSIFLTTCTDVVSMGLFLGLATLLL